MKRTMMYWKARINSKLRTLSNGKLGVPKSYCGRRILSPEQGNDYVYRKLSTNEPFCAARFGSIELSTLTLFERPQTSSRTAQAKAIRVMCNNSGFFPCEVELGYPFAELCKESLKQIDAMAVWFNPLEDYMIDRYGQDIQCMQPQGLEPYYFAAPWSKALKNKRVLVIHPFAKTILKQYQKRQELFANPDVLPEFELITMQAVQTLAGQKDERFATWFDALDYMHQEAWKIDYDVAIIGCGAYGLPLAAKLKQDGKQAIHMGGATQILFGIRGKRWDDMSDFAALFNDAWVRPSDQERPKNANNVENACYW